MKVKILKYKGFKGSVNYDDEDGVYYGNVTNIEDVIRYKTKDKNRLETEFQFAVDDYIARSIEND